MKTWEKDIYMGMDDVLYGINLLDASKKCVEDQDLIDKTEKSIEEIYKLRTKTEPKSRTFDWDKDIVTDTEFGRIIVEIVGCRIDGYLLLKDSDKKITLFSLYEKYGHYESNGDKKKYIQPELLVTGGENLRLKYGNNGRPYFSITKKETKKIVEGK